MSKHVPDGWTSPSLETVCEKIRGVSYKAGEASVRAHDGHVPILRANNINPEGLSFDDLLWVPQARVGDHQKLRRGDVVVAMSSGSKSVVGKTAQLLHDWDGSVGAFCAILRPRSTIDSRYLGRFLQTREYRAEISALAAGSNINNLRNEHFRIVEVPLAPMAEQRRIVAKLDELLSRVDECDKRLSKIPALIKRFRQSVLASACSGRLTADWRATEDPQRARIADATGLPESWQWIPIGEIAAIQTGTTPPKSDTANYSESPDHCPFFKPTDLDAGADVRVAREWLSPEGEWHARVLPPFTVCVTSIGATIGKTGLLRVRGATNQQINAILPASKLDPFFTYFFCISPHFQRRIVEESSSTTLPIINKGRFEQLEFPLPPRREQEEIVRRVQDLLRLVNQIEKHAKIAGEAAQRLRASILIRAFRGELLASPSRARHGHATFAAMVADHETLEVI